MDGGRSSTASKADHGTELPLILCAPPLAHYVVGERRHPWEAIQPNCAPRHVYGTIGHPSSHHCVPTALMVIPIVSQSG